MRSIFESSAWTQMSFSFWRVGNGGLSEMQPFGGLGEPAAFHHRDEAAHEIEVDIGHAHENKEYSLAP